MYVLHLYFSDVISKHGYSCICFFHRNYSYQDVNIIQSVFKIKQEHTNLTLETVKKSFKFFCRYIIINYIYIYIYIYCKYIASNFHTVMFKQTKWLLLKNKRRFRVMGLWNLWSVEVTGNTTDTENIQLQLTQT